MGSETSCGFNYTALPRVNQERMMGNISAVKHKSRPMNKAACGTPRRQPTLSFPSYMNHKFI